MPGELDQSEISDKYRYRKRLKCATPAHRQPNFHAPHKVRSVIEFQNVHKTYRVAGRDIPALNPTSLTIEDGQVFGLIGHSGAGKSTMLRLINRLEEPSGGKIVVDGEDVTAFDANQLRSFRQQVGMIFQHFNLLASKTVADNVALPLVLAGELPRAQIDKRVTELLARVGLQDHAKSIRPNCRAGRSSASASPAPCPPTRRSCCATRPPVPSIRKPPPRCCNCWRRSTAS